MHCFIVFSFRTFNIKAIDFQNTAYFVARIHREGKGLAALFLFFSFGQSWIVTKAEIKLQITSLPNCAGVRSLSVGTVYFLKLLLL